MGPTTANDADGWQRARAMANRPIVNDPSLRDHQSWVQNRLILETGFQEAIRHGFTLISAGFGSFALFEGLATTQEREALPRTFALVLNVVGVVVILLAANHFRRMSAWIDADEFGAAGAPKLPEERRPMLLAAGAVLIGAVSFVALLLLP